jgi:hypothetical protein
MESHSGLPAPQPPRRIRKGRPHKARERSGKYLIEIPESFCVVKLFIRKTGAEEHRSARAKKKVDERWLDEGRAKKQGATGITTVAPYIAGQWGRGE